MASKDKKRERILESAVQCLASSPSASLNDIADHAQIGIATLHRHFNSREKLILEIALNAVKSVSMALDSVSLDNRNIRVILTEIITVLIPLGDKIYFLMSEYFLDDVPEFTAKEQDLWAALETAVKQWQEQGVLRADMKASWMLNVMYTLLFAVWKDVHDGVLAAQDAPGLLAATLLDGFLKE